MRLGRGNTIFCTLATLLPLLAMPYRSAGQAAAAGEMVHAATERSTMLTLSIGGGSWQLSSIALAALPQTSVTVHNAHGNTDETYMGVAVGDLLAHFGLSFTKPNEKQIYHSYLRAQGTDRYFVLLSGAEVESTMHNGNVIVALQRNGKALEDDGLFKLVVTEDKRPARWVRSLTSLTLVTVN